jgi:hypothetical protein
MILSGNWLKNSNLALGYSRISDSVKKETHPPTWDWPTRIGEAEFIFW